MRPRSSARRAGYSAAPHDAAGGHRPQGQRDLTLGVFLARPERGLAAAILSEAPGARALRWLIPTMIVLLFGLGWLRLRGQRAGLYETETGVALTTVTSIALLTILLLPAARIVHGLERDRRRAEEALRAPEERYRQFFRANPAGAYRSRRDGTVLEVNAAFVRMLGYASPEEILGRPAPTLYDDPAERDALMTALEPDRPTQRAPCACGARTVP